MGRRGRGVGGGAEHPPYACVPRHRCLATLTLAPPCWPPSRAGRCPSPSSTTRQGGGEGGGHGRIITATDVRVRVCCLQVLRILTPMFASGLMDLPPCPTCTEVRRGCDR